jgi:hypothetical protein
LPLLFLILLSYRSLCLASLSVTTPVEGRWQPATLNGHTQHHVVKAFRACGNTDNLYTESFSSLHHNAPLMLLDVDEALCTELRAGELSHESARRLVNRTVLVRESDVSRICHFGILGRRVAMYIALDKAGVRASILSTIADVPGMTSNRVTMCVAKRPCA